MEHSGSADDVAKDSSRAGIQEHELAEESSSDLPSTAMPSSAPHGSSPYASFFLPSASKVDDHDDRDVTHGASDSAGIKKLEHALPSEPISSTGLGMIDSLERPPPVSTTSNHEVTPGAFPVVPSSHNPASSQTLRSRPRRSYDSSGRELTNEESKQDDGVPNSAGAYAGSNDSAREAMESGLYTVEALLVSDGNDDETMIVAEAKSVKVKWYQRRWILACGLVGAVVVIVVLVVRPQSASSNSSLTSPTPAPIISSLAFPTPAPTSSTPELIACNFLSIPNVTKCRSTFVFDTQYNASDKTTGFTIPSEIGVLTQLTTVLIDGEALTSTIPSEIGLWTQLTELYFNNNSLTGTIPSSLCSLTSLYGSIGIDDGEITCMSGCCTYF